MGHLHRNIIANIGGRLWNIISIYLFIPFYIQILGIRLYGLIGFYALMQSMLAIADLGFTATLQREFALDHSKEKKYKLLRSVEFIYAVFGILLALVFIIAATFIARSWLNTEGLPEITAIHSIRYLGIAICLQILSTIYMGGLMGLERQVLANGLQIVWGIFKSGVVILALMYVAPTAEVFFLWQIVVNIAFIIALRYFLSTSLRIKASEKQWKLSELFPILNTIWRFTGGIIVLGLISSFVSQMDKLIISKYLPISDFAVYNLGASIGIAPYVLANPIALALYPRITAMLARKELDHFHIVLERAYKVIAVICATTGVIIALYSFPVLNLWTGNTSLSLDASIIASTLVIGQMFLSLQILPYYITLSNADTKTSIRVGVFGLPVLLGSLLFIVKRNGIIGVCLCFTVYHFITTCIYIYQVVRKHSRLSPLRFLLVNALLPVLLVSSIAGLLYYITPSIFEGNSIFIYIAFNALLTFILSLSIIFRASPIKLYYTLRKNFFDKL